MRWDGAGLGHIPGEQKELEDSEKVTLEAEQTLYLETRWISHQCHCREVGGRRVIQKGMKSVCP